jgi:hypothetical protein
MESEPRFARGESASFQNLAMAPTEAVNGFVPALIRPEIGPYSQDT